MTSKTFTQGTVIDSPWLNDVNDLTYFTQDGTGAVERPGRAKLAEVSVSITDFGGQPGLVFDNTAAFNLAVAKLGTAGGVIDFPVGDWRGNFLLNQHNINLRGRGGVGEVDQSCLRPYLTGASTATVQVSNGTRVNRKCGIRDIVISGDNGSGVMASKALYLAGGTVHFSGHNFDLMDGEHSLHIEPSGGLPVTTSWFSQWHIRTDYSVANSRSIYIKRNLDPEYVTSIFFAHGHINGPSLGYAIEADGTLSGISLTMVDVYIDSYPDHGVMLKGSSGIICHDFQVDPGAAGEFVIETDQVTKDPSRYIVGNCRIGGQKMKFAGATEITLPSEADTFSYRARMKEPFFGDLGYFTPATDPYNTTIYYDFQTATGPMRINGTDLHAKSTTQVTALTTAALATTGGFACSKNAFVGGNLFVYGGNATSSGNITSNAAGGGLYLEATGTDVHIKSVPTGVGYSIFSASGIRPTSDNVQNIGSSGFRWKEIFCANAVINTSDREHKDRIEEIPQKWLDAWAEVEWVRFKFKDAIATKGDGARWHVGAIAQQVKATFEKYDIDPFAIGLLCFDEWGDEFEDEAHNITITNSDGTKAHHRELTGKKKLVRAAGSIYGIRYEQALVMEAALMRSKVMQLEARLSALKGK